MSFRCINHCEFALFPTNTRSNTYFTNYCATIARKNPLIQFLGANPRSRFSERNVISCHESSITLLIARIRHLMPSTKFFVHNLSIFTKFSVFFVDIWGGRVVPCPYMECILASNYFFIFAFELFKI